MRTKAWASGVVVESGRVGVFGGFLIRHLVRLMVKEEELQEELEDQRLEASQSIVLPPEENSSRLQMNLAKPPPETAQNTK